jgi:hypothetical protein
MANQTGIAIIIKAFLPTGKTLDEQFAALSIVKTAHETGDYAPVLAAASIDEVKAEQKTRRIEEAPASDKQTDTEGTITAPLPGGQSGDETISDEDVPAFLKGDKKSKAA